MTDTVVAIESVRITRRHRKDLGDLRSLMASIREVGLLNPITLTRDARLVAGQRRIEAYKRLGEVTIPARYVDNLSDAVLALRAELDENTERKAMLPSELASLGAALAAIQSENGREAQRAAGRENGRGIASGADSGSYRQGETREIVGSALGMSGRTYDLLHAAHEAANSTEPEVAELGREALDEMDHTGSIWGPGKKLHRQLRARRDGTEVREEPAPAARTQVAAERLERMRELAGRGYTSTQIAEAVGVAADWVRQRARDHGITIHADQVLGNSRKRIDSARIIRETVSTLDNLMTGLGLVDFDDLDQTQIEDWVRSLTTSITALNRLKKQLKEKTQ